MLVLIGLAAAGVYLSAFIVHQNERALVLEFGKPKRVIDTAGLNWKIPIVETVEFFDKRILDLDLEPKEIPATDQKLIKVDAFVRYRIHDPLKFYQTMFDETRVVPVFGPIVESTLRRVLGSASFLDIVRDKREPLMNRIAKEVNEQGQQFGIEVVDVRIKRADLPDKNLQSVYERMKAARRQEAEEFRAQGRAAANKIRADAEREATVIRAEAYRKSEQIKGAGDGERNRIFAEAFGKDPEFASFYRHMQAYETALKAGETRLLLTPDSEFFRYFNAIGGEGAARKP
jgi:membrane protease subunit HflC